MKNRKILMDEWLAAIEEITKPPPVPEGWVSKSELAAGLGISLRVTKEVIFDLKKKGMIERRLIRQFTAGGQIRTFAFYRLKRPGVGKDSSAAFNASTASSASRAARSR